VEVFDLVAHGRDLEYSFYEMTHGSGCRGKVITLAFEVGPPSPPSSPPSCRVVEGVLVVIVLAAVCFPDQAHMTYERPVVMRIAQVRPVIAFEDPRHEVIHRPPPPSLPWWNDDDNVNDNDNGNDDDNDDKDVDNSGNDNDNKKMTKMMTNSCKIGRKLIAVQREKTRIMARSDSDFSKCDKNTDDGQKSPGK